MGQKNFRLCRTPFTPRFPWLGLLYHWNMKFFPPPPPSGSRIGQPSPDRSNISMDSMKPWASPVLYFIRRNGMTKWYIPGVYTYIRRMVSSPIAKVFSNSSYSSYFFCSFYFSFFFFFFFSLVSTFRFETENMQETVQVPVVILRSRLSRYTIPFC